VPGRPRKRTIPAVAHTKSESGAHLELRRDSLRNRETDEEFAVFVNAAWHNLTVQKLCASGLAQIEDLRPNKPDKTA
jgi:hypothetical protein